VVGGHEDEVDQPLVVQGSVVVGDPNGAGEMVPAVTEMKVKTVFPMAHLAGCEHLETRILEVHPTVCFIYATSVVSA
jgi:hypothetical protein